MNAVNLSKATAHATRVEILEQFPARAGGRLSPNVLAEQLGESLPNVSYHVRELERLGTLRLMATAPVRGALEHYYELTDAGVIARAAGRTLRRQIEKAREAAGVTAA